MKKYAGCRQVSSVGGHEKWEKDGCLRSVILQSHISPVPEFIIKSNLRTLGLSRADFMGYQHPRLSYDRPK